MPVIGISTYRQPASWSSWEGVTADILPTAYAESVVETGGAPLLVPPVPSLAAAKLLVTRIDGLIIAGGSDVNPARYRQKPHGAVTTWYDDRDASELWLLDAAAPRQLPVLGICRGMQIMAVHAGGSIIQHLPDDVGNSSHSGLGNAYGATNVMIESGHRISALVDPSLIVACHHHQGVSTHPGFVATAHSGDGVLEAMEAEGERFLVGVQWHPETTKDKGLFAGLIAAAGANRSNSGTR
ncbi:MAG: gamma-glutamyl-gamma-aminobutyrate hydrolase family protein [Cryobacterium sp.]|nr:gamma-glutamyl-gamma-aminobutyrate hydrolase family protein [Micrococcales bacterium]MBX3079695.1 gamma-glutamyl-gamma-aminobutyrate hydrolase family protein [Cryobacterium sp.]